MNDLAAGHAGVAVAAWKEGFSVVGGEFGVLDRQAGQYTLGLYAIAIATGCSTDLLNSLGEIPSSR